jgi:hypothetical protein
MAMEYRNFFHPKAIQNLPKVGSLVWKPSGNPAQSYERELQHQRYKNATSSLVRF